MVDSAGFVDRSYAPRTRAVARLADPAFDRATDEDGETLAADLSRNKFSLEFLDGAAGEDDAAHRRAREHRFQSITAALNDAGVEYTSMKNLRAPKAMMSDIDLLIADPGQQARAAYALTTRGFEFYQFRLLAHPRKFMAKQSPDDPRPVDVYPDAIWIRKKVCDAHTVIERAADGGRRLPAPEDDLYLVATHAFSHLSVTLAELLHGVHVLDDADSFDWSYVLATAGDYGCADALYVYLRLLDTHLRLTDREPVPTAVFDALSEEWVCAVARRWWTRTDATITYPVELPLWLANVVSSLYHVPRVARHATPIETIKDFESHYLAAASKTLLGEA